MDIPFKKFAVVSRQFSIFIILCQLPTANCNLVFFPLNP